MKVIVLTLFPELVEAVMSVSIPARAVTKGALDVKCINPREYTADVHRTVDEDRWDASFGMAFYNAIHELHIVHSAVALVVHNKVVALGPIGL